MNFNQRIQRALKMSAVGDAIGDMFEFKRYINPFEVHDHIRNDSSIVITDDTQMSLFGFEAIQKYARDTTIDHINEAYVRWYETQMGGGAYDIGLLAEPLMHYRRAPGNTCLSALESIYHFEPVKNDSYGCGSVMRLLPFVWLLMKQPKNAIELAVQSGAITHKHKKNEKAIIDYMLVAKLAIDPSMLTTVEDLRVSEYILNLVKYNHISELGSGWTAQECVDMAVWAAWTSETFEECLVKSIAHDGDSDSVAAVACGLYSLLHDDTHRNKVRDDTTLGFLFNRLVEKDVVQSICNKIV